MNLRKIFSVRERVAERTLRTPPSATWWNGDREALARFVSVAFVMCIALSLRLWGLNQIGFNTDETVYAGQGAAIAQVPVLKDIFPVFRAHPLLLQFFL